MAEEMVTSYSCEKCDRKFATQDGLINHLKTLHAQREKTPYKKNDPNQTQD